jgi:hypothetical protein
MYDMGLHKTHLLIINLKKKLLLSRSMGPRQKKTIILNLKFSFYQYCNMKSFFD